MKNNTIRISNGYIKTIGPINLKLPSSGLFCFDSNDSVLNLLFSKILTGETKLSNGVYFYNEVSVDKRSKVNLKEKDVALIDENDLLLELSTLENIKMFDSSFDKERLEECFKLVDLKFNDYDLSLFINKKLLLIDEISRIKISLSLKLYYGYQTIIYKKLNLTEEIISILKKLQNEALIIVFANNHQYFDENKVISFKDNALEFIYSQNNYEHMNALSTHKKKLSFKLIAKNFITTFRSCSKQTAISMLSTSLIAGSVISVVDFSTNDPLVNQIRECHRANLDFVKITNYESGYTRQGKFVSGSLEFNDDDVEKIEEHFNNNIYSIEKSYIKINDDKEEFNVYSIQYSDSLDLKIDSRISDTKKCKNPNNIDEIGISWFVADNLIKNNFTYKDEKIKNVNDLIGTKINNKTIVNIYETEDKEIYESSYLNDKNDLIKTSNTSFLLSESIFIYEDPFSRSSQSSFLVKLTNNQYEDIKFLKTFNNQIFGIGRRVDVHSFFDVYMFYNDYFSLGNIAYMILPLLIYITFIVAFSYFGIKKLKVYKDELRYNSKFYLNNGVNKTRTLLINGGSLIIIDLISYGGAILVSSVFLWAINLIWGNAYSSFSFSPLGLAFGVIITLVLSLFPYTEKKK